MSSLVHFVTQWMSTVNFSCGSCRNSAHDHDTGLSTAPRIVKSHAFRGVYGVGPADNTGKSRVTYWPGGTREDSAARRPMKPLVTAIRPSHRAAHAAATAASPTSRPP